MSYSLSKLYNVLFTKALSERIGKRGLSACLHPGVVRTELMREIQSDGLKGKLSKVALQILFPIWWLFSKSSSEGNQTTMYTLLSDKVESGGYYADCAPSKVNSQVTKENWDRLWEISESSLKTKFNA